MLRASPFGYGLTIFLLVITLAVALFTWGTEEQEVRHTTLGTTEKRCTDAGADVCVCVCFVQHAGVYASIPLCVLIV